MGFSLDVLRYSVVRFLRSAIRDLRAHLSIFAAGGRKKHEVHVDKSLARRRRPHRVASGTSDMESPPPFSVNHDVRFPSNRDGVSLRAVSRPVRRVSEDDSAKRRQRKMRVTARSERRSEARGGDVRSEDASLSGHGVVIIRAQIRQCPDDRALAAELASRHSCRQPRPARHGRGQRVHLVAGRRRRGGRRRHRRDYARDPSLSLRAPRGILLRRHRRRRRHRPRDFVSLSPSPTARPLVEPRHRRSASLLLHRHRPARVRQTQTLRSGAISPTSATEFARRCCAPWDVRVYGRGPLRAERRPVRQRPDRTSEGSFENIERTSTSAPGQTSASAEEVVEDDVWSDLYADLMSPKRRRGETLTAGRERLRGPARHPPRSSFRLP